jgi:hypothetical protein
MRTVPGGFSSETLRSRPKSGFVQLNVGAAVPGIVPKGGPSVEHQFDLAGWQAGLSAGYILRQSEYRTNKGNVVESE